VTAEGLGPRAFPPFSSIIRSYGDDERVDGLIADQDHLISGHNRRTTHAIDIAEWAEGHAPAFGAVESVGHQSEIAKEDINILAVAGWSRRRGGVQLIERFSTVARALAPPQDLAGPTAQTKRVELVMIDRGEKDAVTGEDRRRMTERQRRLPNNVAPGAKRLG